MTCILYLATLAEIQQTMLLSVLADAPILNSALWMQYDEWDGEYEENDIINESWLMNQSK